MSNLLHMNYPLDIPRMLAVAEVFKLHAKPYGAEADHPDPRIPQGGIPYWLIARTDECDVTPDNMEYITQIVSDIGVFCKPRFFYQENNFTMPKHTDFGNTCSINFVLSENPAPITILDEDYNYTQALINTSVLHGVRNGDTDRVLFKLSIFDLTFDEVSEHLKLKGYAK